MKKKRSKVLSYLFTHHFRVGGHVHDCRTLRCATVSALVELQPFAR